MITKCKICRKSMWQILTRSVLAGVFDNICNNCLILVNLIYTDSCLLYVDWRQLR